MNHRVKGRKFKRDGAQRKALMKHLAESIILQERIKTTTAKAKELSSYLEKLVTCAKKNDLASAKSIHSQLSKEPAKKLLQDLSKRYSKRLGGYTRVVKAGERKGDAAEVSVVEFV